MSSDRPQKRRRGDDRDRRDSGGGRGGGRGGGERRDVAKRIRTLIERLGEQSKESTQDNIHGVAGVLLNDLAEFNELIVETIVTCAASKPERTSIYSTLVGLLNAESFDTGKAIIEQLCSKLASYLETCDFPPAASLVRFLADLGNASVLLPGSLVGLLQALVNVTKEENIPQSRSDVYATMVLGVMPWVGRDLAERSTEAFTSLLSVISDYVDGRSTAHVSPLSVYTEVKLVGDAASSAPAQQDALELLWAQVTSLQRRDWKENAVVRPYIYFDEILVKSMQHSLPEIPIPAHKERTESAGDLYPAPSVAFRLFGTADAPEDCALPPSRAVERYLYETTVREVLYTFYPDVPLVSRQYAEMVRNNRDVPYNYVIVEVLLGEIFRLPTTRVSLVYYFAIISELVRLIQVPFVEVLLLGMDHQFHRLQQLEVECSARYTKWVAHFLNNYEFKFRWKDWFDVVTVEEEMPQAVFVKEALAGMVQLSYHDHIAKEIQLPPQLRPFMPPVPEPLFKYSGITEEAQKSLAIKELMAIVRVKNVKVEDVKALIEKIEIPETMTLEEGADREERLVELRVEVFVNCILKVGSRTIYHLDTILKRQLKPLKEICSDSEAKNLIVRFTTEFWQKNPQMMTIALDKMQSMQIIDASSVVEWVFSPTAADLYTRFVPPLRNRAASAAQLTHGSCSLAFLSWRAGTTYGTFSSTH
jgi:nuclear cap-binding protein subunit 1